MTHLLRPLALVLLLAVAAQPASAQPYGDLVFANAGGSGQTNRVCVNDGSGAFACSDVSPDNTGTRAVVIGNFGGGALPVELASFEGSVDAQGVVLRWQTATETNNAGFEVQQRVGEAFEAVAFVEGRGTTTEAQHYEQRVGGLAPGRHVFRLEQIDLDGTSAYSAEVEVTVGVPGTHVLSEVYPNPFGATAQFTLAVATAQDVRVEVFDLLGRRVARLHEGKLAGGGTHRFAVEAASWPSGLYVLRVRGETFAATRRVTVLR